MTNANGWKNARNDPSAGVTLWRRISCPRCGNDKGSATVAKPGICRDCSGSMTPEERRVWRGQPRPGARQKEAA